MGERERPLRVEYELGEVVRRPVNEREREVTRRYVQERFGVHIDDQVANGIVFALTPPQDPCTLTFQGIDGTSCTIDSSELRAPLS